MAQRIQALSDRLAVVLKPEALQGTAMALHLAGADYEPRPVARLRERRLRGGRGGIRLREYLSVFGLVCFKSLGSRIHRIF